MMSLFCCILFPMAQLACVRKDARLMLWLAVTRQLIKLAFAIKAFPLIIHSVKTYGVHKQLIVPYIYDTINAVTRHDILLSILYPLYIAYTGTLMFLAFYYTYVQREKDDAKDIESDLKKHAVAASVASGLCWSFACALEKEKGKFRIVLEDLLQGVIELYTLSLLLRICLDYFDSNIIPIIFVISDTFLYTYYSFLSAYGTHLTLKCVPNPDHRNE